MTLESDSDWPVIGEVISDDPNYLLGPAREHFDQRRQTMGNGLRDDHEVATILEEELVPADTIRFKADRRRSTVRARAYKFTGEHKGTVIAASTLTVAGLLLATHRLHVRRKNKD